MMMVMVAVVVVVMLLCYQAGRQADRQGVMVGGEEAGGDWAGGVMVLTERITEVTFACR